MKKKIVITILLFYGLTGYAQNEKIDYSNLTLGNFSWGFDIGGGYSILSGNVKNYLGNHGSFNGGFFFSYKKVTYDLRFILGSPVPKKDFQNSEYYFYKDSINMITNVTNSFGYMILENGFINLYPSLGVNMFQMAKAMETNKDTDGPIKITPVLGINLDYKFYRVNADWYLANFYFKTGLSWIPFNYVGDLRGSQLNINLTIGFYGRTLKN